MTEALTVEEGGRTITFTFDDMMRYHGVHSPGGVAMAFKVMQRAFAALSPDGPTPRREVTVRTAFRGPGARDGFEAVTRGVTDGRYTVDRTLVRPDRGRFIDLARADRRTAEQENRLDELKAELAQRVMATPAAAVYDLA